MDVSPGLSVTLLRQVAENAARAAAQRAQHQRDVTAHAAVEFGEKRDEVEEKSETEEADPAATYERTGEDESGRLVDIKA